MAQKIIQMQMRHLHFNLKDLLSNRKGFVILTSLLRFKNKSWEFREYSPSIYASLGSMSRVIIHSFIHEYMVIHNYYHSIE